MLKHLDVVPETSSGSIGSPISNDDKWTPISDSPNSWLQVGIRLGKASDFGRTHYEISNSQPTWGLTSTPYYTQKDTPFYCKVGCGAGATASSGWSYYSSSGVYRDIDLSHCGFTSAPIVVTSLAGDTGLWTTPGGSEPYSVTSSGFRIFVYKSDVTAPAAESYGWHINWIATEIYDPSLSSPIAMAAPTEGQVLFWDAGMNIYPGSGSTISDLSGNGNNLFLKVELHLRTVDLGVVFLISTEMEEFILIRRYEIFR